jgi:hypothetical protein
VSAPALTDAVAVACWLGSALEADGIPCAITGALALAVYGVPRMTKDADLAVFVEPAQRERLLDTLERAGCLFPRAWAAAEMARIGWFYLRCGKVEVDIFVAQHPFQREAMTRRVRIEVPGYGPRWFHSAEDLAINKLALSRHKDLADLEALFAVQGSALDTEYIRRWLEAITPEADPRRAVLEDLERRFARRDPTA